VLNGATDWVYEEEFTLVQGYAWSPDGNRKLLYLRSDESAVKEFDLTYYKNQLYPNEYRFKYPKAGEVNSTVSLNTVRCEQRPHVRGTASAPTLHRHLRGPRLGLHPERAALVHAPEPLAEPEGDLSWCKCPPPGTKFGNKPAEIYPRDEQDLCGGDGRPVLPPDGSGFVLTSERSGWNHLYCGADLDGEGAARDHHR
jgi:dipeptidyl-peptidase-4